MRLTPIFLTAVLGLYSAISATALAGPNPIAGTIDSFFHYRPPPPPVGGDCNVIAAEVGPDAVWRGEFSGKRLNSADNYVPYSARGCFATEYACRVWQQEALNYAFGVLTYTSCRQGARW